MEGDAKCLSRDPLMCTLYIFLGEIDFCKCFRSSRSGQPLVMPTKNQWSFKRCNEVTIAVQHGDSKVHNPVVVYWPMCEGPFSSPVHFPVHSLEKKWKGGCP